MNKKILFVSILAVFMLLTLVFVSTVTSDTSKTVRKESPLFRIRTRRAIREKIGDLLKRFVGDGVFFLPFQWLRNGMHYNEKKICIGITKTPYTESKTLNTCDSIFGWTCCYPCDP